MKLTGVFLGIVLLVCSLNAWSAAQAQPLRIIATPNPNVFPLLIALHEHPELPVRLVPVKDSLGINKAMAQGADGVLAMTYAVAQKVVAGSVPDLALEGVYYWRGFFEMTVPEVHSFKDLQGKGLIVSGPTGGGSGGAPDLFFQAALSRAGMFAEDYSVCYLPVMQGIKLLESGKPMKTEKTCQGAMPAAGIMLVEPAVTGLKMKSSMPFSSGRSVQRGIDLQKLFTGYSAWTPGELPHGGFAIRRHILSDPVKKAQYAAFIKAYREAIDRINSADGMFSRIKLGRIISKGISKYYGQYKMDLPTMVVARAMANGDMRFRDDYKMSVIRNDLDKFLKEVLNTQTLPSSLYL